MDFKKAIDRVLGHEGGYVNDPADPGGETKWGISKRSYPNLNIKDLTREDAVAIYHRDFWAPLKADRFHDGVAYQLLDSAVNSGVTQSIRFMQRALGVADDGIFGPVSLGASEKMSETDQIFLFLAERLDFMTKLKNWPNHGRGWARRIAANLRLAADDS
ncbi:MAG: glycoside hydrolase family 108 protein [Candidatus Babeliales bacterium]